MHIKSSDLQEVKSPPTSQSPHTEEALVSDYGMVTAVYMINQIIAE